MLDFYTSLQEYIDKISIKYILVTFIRFLFSVILINYFDNLNIVDLLFNIFLLQVCSLIYNFIFEIRNKIPTFYYKPNHKIITYIKASMPVSILMLVLM